MQTKRASLCETVANQAVGWVLNYAAGALIFNLNTRENIALNLVRMGISLGRTYGIRRFFNWIHIRRFT